MKSILGVLLAAITFLSHPFIVHGQDVEMAQWDISRNDLNVK